MEIKKTLKTLSYLFILTLTLSCSNNHDSIVDEGQDQGSLFKEVDFVLKSQTDFFINRDQTITIKISGNLDTGVLPAGITITEQGLVYAKTSSPSIANGASTATINGGSEINGEIVMDKNNVYFVRGYIKKSDNTYFYGNQIEVNTTIDASSSRTLVMNINTPSNIQISSTTIIAPIDLTKIEKESPTELGCQYSLNNDFSNASIALITPGNGDFRINLYQPEISNLTTNTVYYIRPYAKYADGTITNGGTNTITVTTD